ncbi:MAG: hypothetical protein RL414_465 [Actinomycetota bacterium]|jgi:ribosomal protein S18 acetylase RimI-like enzyme
MGHDENFEGISVDELEMFFARRAELVGHTNLLYQTSTDEVVGVAGLMYDPSREKFWTQTAAKFGSPFIPATVLETIKNAQSIEPAFKLQPVVNDKDPSHIAAWESHGFKKIQTSYVMKRTHLPTEYPILPTGVNMRTLREDADWASIQQIQNDAFEGHFGFVPRTLENFKAFRLDAGMFDPDGIHILSVNGIDAGFVEINNEIAHINQGFINVIGVKHSHHKQGLGKILLQWAFAYCASQGRDGVELFVDIENKTGALAFYESAGMVAQSAFSTYENPDWATLKL